MPKITKAAAILHGFFREVKNRKLYFVPSIEMPSPENGNTTHSIMRFVLGDEK